MCTKVRICNNLCSGGNGDYGGKIESNGDFDIDSDGTVGADTDCDL